MKRRDLTVLVLDFVLQRRSGTLLGTLWNIVFGDMTALQGPADSFLIFRLEIVNAIQI
jgi:hypothetical protein